MDEYLCDYVIEKFLKRHFPKKKIRQGVKFKIGYVIPSKFTGTEEKLYIRKTELEYVYEELYPIVQNAFGLNKDEIMTILVMYLR